MREGGVGEKVMMRWWFVFQPGKRYMTVREGGVGKVMMRWWFAFYPGKRSVAVREGGVGE